MYRLLISIHNHWPYKLSVYTFLEVKEVNTVKHSVAMVNIDLDIVSQINIYHSDRMFYCVNLCHFQERVHTKFVWPMIVYRNK